jgi:SAM-dependent methyltransferase
VIRLDAATVLLQWAVGGLFFLWVTTRAREVGIGYGWLLRGIYLLMAAGALVLGLWIDPVPVREASSVAVVLASGFALGVSIIRRKAGVRGEHERKARKVERVAAMTGIERTYDDPADSEGRDRGPEFPPQLDLIAPLVGVPGLIAAGVAAGDPALLSVARVLVGAAFLGAVSDAMLLGHWYLVQPGLARRPLLELVRWTGLTWPLEVIVLLWPTGMFSVLDGTIDDGWDGMLGWFWVACAVTTIVLVAVTRAALRERYYSAVMAATGLLYLAILTAFGTDLVARAVLA